MTGDAAGGLIATSVQLQAQRSLAAWPRNWRATVLSAPPMIAPARQFVYPTQIVGEEDALARGALQIMVHPAGAGSFLATYALGFSNAAMPTALFACPNPDEFCAVAGGYVYVVDSMRPEVCTHLSMRPVVEVRVLANDGLLLFVGFNRIMAWSAQGLAWESARLSWEGVRIGDTAAGKLSGYGWNARTDLEVEFTLDLRTGQHSGGGF